jgi:hypothetical protein
MKASESERRQAVLADDLFDLFCLLVVGLAEPNGRGSAEVFRAAVLLIDTFWPDFWAADYLGAARVLLGCDQVYFDRVIGPSFSSLRDALVKQDREATRRRSARQRALAKVEESRGRQLRVYMARRERLAQSRNQHKEPLVTSSAIEMRDFDRALGLVS